MEEREGIIKVSRVILGYYTFVFDLFYRGRWICQLRLGVTEENGIWNRQGFKVCVSL